MKVATPKEQWTPASAPGNATRKQEYLVPEVDIVETEAGYQIEAEMPGVSKEGLEVTLEGAEVTIVGHRRQETLNGTPLLRESSALDYRRVFETDPAIDATKVSAKMEQGVLTLLLPKSEQAKPRQIKVD